MRVLTVGNFYPPAVIGGYEVAWASSNDQLRDRGHEVRVLTSDHRAGELGPEPGVARALRMYWTPDGFPRRGALERLAIERTNRATLKEQLKAHQPDVVAWWGMGGMSMSLIESVRRLGLPAVGVVCDDWMVYGPEVDGWTRPLSRHERLARVAELITRIPARPRFADAGAWLFLSETVRRRAREGGVDVRDTEICNRGPDENLFQPVDERKEWGGRLLYAGRIDERKGIGTVVEALPHANPETTLVIDGEGEPPQRQALDDLIERTGLHSRVEVRKTPRERLPEVYAEADAVVFPVLWEEPWGLVPLEAMAMGRPVIATGRGGSGEYLRDRENALLFEAGDERALARAVAELAADPGLRARLREGGFSTAGEFSARGFNEQIERALASAAG